MRPSEAIKIIKELIRSVEIVYKTNPLTDKEPHSATDAITLAISALEKQEQTNAQSVNSMRTSRPNALESLNILEQAKDDKGCVPMSLVRQVFRNVMEQAVDKYCETCKHKKRSTTDWPCIDCYLSSCQVEDHYEPYTEEES